MNEIFDDFKAVLLEVGNYFLELANRFLVAFGKEPEDDLGDALKTIFGMIEF